jgi:hypothetical protein
MSSGRSARRFWSTAELAMLDLSDPISLLLAAADALSAAQIRAATYGGLALAAYGEPRETRDADFAVGAPCSDDCARALERAGHEVTLQFADIRFGGNTLTRFAVSGGGTLNTIDLVVPRSPRFAAAVLDRAIDGQLRGRTIAVVSPEDFVLLKVLSTRARDVEDARSVMAVRAGDLDRDLLAREIEALAAELGDHDVRGRWIQISG